MARAEVAPGPTGRDTTPLVVDLDGSLITSDVAMEALVRVATRGWRLFATAALLLLGGRRARLKAWLARVQPVEPDGLVYRPAVLALIGEARGAGRPVILASAAHRRNVVRVARHLGLFDGVIASTARRNRRGAAKLAAIRARLGGGPFDYVGDARADRPIWAAARVAHTTDRPTGTDREHRLVPRQAGWRPLARAARPHQWAKNALVFLPLVTSGNLGDAGDWRAAGVTFLCLCAVASSVYLLNDVLDLDADRRHPVKRARPIAAGELSIPAALGWSAGLAAAGLATAAAATATPAALAIAAYWALTLAYSLKIKAAIIADVLTLAGLYTMRLIVGAAAIGVAPSMWLLMFSIFFFLSLGYLKRFVELDRSALSPDRLLAGRGYIRADAALVAMSGVAAGMVSVLVILLFAAEMERSDQYAVPSLLWLTILPLVYWLNRMWLMATRGQVDSDPVAFALRDRRSLAVAAVLGLTLVEAKYGLLLALT